MSMSKRAYLFPQERSEEFAGPRASGRRNARLLHRARTGLEQRR
jgi:hypothetical protein